MRITIIDDEAAERNKLHQYIERFGREQGQAFEIAEYTSGSELLAQYRPVHDILIFDIDMPGISGMEAARAVRKVDEKAAILFVTNIAQYAINGYEVDAVDYIIKPIGYSVILGTTKMVCENVVRPVGTVPALLPVFHFLRYFLEAIMLLLSVLMGTMLWYFYDRLSIRNEKDILARLVKERRSQYEFSRENIEMINRKSHDLKHQLRVLEQISDEERREKLRDALITGGSRRRILPGEGKK